MDSSLLDEEFDSTVGLDIDGEFEVHKVAEEFVVETLEEEDLDNDDNEVTTTATRRMTSIIP